MPTENPTLAPSFEPDSRPCNEWTKLYQGKCYGSISQRGIDDEPSPDGSWYRLPPSYHLVNYSADIQANVASQHPFGTLRLIYADGSVYGSGKDGLCTLCECGYCNVSDALNMMYQYAVGGEIITEVDYATDFQEIPTSVFISRLASGNIIQRL